MSHPIESIGHVYFDDHSMVSSFPTRVYGFLDQDDVVDHSSLFYKSTLVWGDKLMRRGLIRLAMILVMSL
jgi:hypothetical protein